MPRDNVDPAVVWAECSPETVTIFSAVSYYFGRCIHKELYLPVGLIKASWGGTRIETWMPPQGFAMSGNPAEPDLVNKALLPASPFRSDR